MTERESGDLPTARTKVGIVADTQSAGLLLHGCENRVFDLAFAAGLNNNHLQPEAMHSGFRELNIVLHQARIVWIHKEGDPTGAGNNFMQQFKPLGDQVDPHKGYSSSVSPRTSETGYEPGSDRIRSGREYDRDRLRRRHRRPDGDVTCAG